MSSEITGAKLLGDNASLVEVLAFHDKLIISKINRKVYVFDDREDCIQEVRTNIIHHYRNLDQDGLNNISEEFDIPYVTSIINNVIFDYIRKKTGIRADSFLVRQYQIFDWNNLSKLLSKKQPEFLWICRYIKEANEFDDSELEQTLKLLIDR